MTGTEVAKSVKHLRPDIDVVIITGYASVDTAVECMKYGAMDYVEKPFSEDELRRFVSHALIRRQDRILKQLQPRIHVIGEPESGPSPDGEFSIPGGALVSDGHCWASLAEDGTAKVGLDDFARKAIGRIESIEFPETGKKVKAGEPLFTVIQGQRKMVFRAPISGTVVMTNAALTTNAGAIQDFAYGGNWVCAIEGDDLDSELGSLKIGKAAVAFFQEEVGRFQEFLQSAGMPASEALRTGALGKLDDSGWSRAAEAFFTRG